MIYIKNNTEIQTIFIPRNELQKEAYIASTKTYEDGYKDGFGKGKQYQKDQLLNLYATENGEYEREDGWGIVTVDIPIEECPDCPEGGSCNLGEGEVYLTANDAGFYELYAADDGYDGWSKFYVTLENAGAIKIHKAEELIQMFNEGWGIDFGTYHYVGGKITEIQEVSMQYGNATYTLDNGFSVYRGKWLEGNPFWDENQIKVGAYIAVYGIIQNYNGQLQFKAGSQVIAYQECEGGEVVSCNIQDYKWVRPSMADRAENGDIYIYPDEGFDAIGYIDFDPNGIYSEGYNDAKAEGILLEDKWITPSMGDRDGNGYVVTYPSEGFDGLSRVVLDPTTIYNEGVIAGKAEGGDLTIGTGDIYLTPNERGQRFEILPSEWEYDAFDKFIVELEDFEIGGSCNVINPIIFSETEGNTINAEGVEIPTFVYEGNQHYNIWALNMAEYEEFKIQIRFQPTNGGYEEPVNIFGCEDTDWDNTTFGARIYMGNIYFRMSGMDVAYQYNEWAWYDVEMGYNSSKRWIIVNGETILETDQAFFNKPNQNFMIGAINSGGNAFRPFYGKIAATYIEVNGNQVYLLPKEDGHMDVYWNDKGSPWVSISGENNARFETEYMSGDGMKTITWLGKRVFCPSVQEEALQYDTIAFTYTVDGWNYHNLNRDNITNDCGERPLDCLLLRNRKGECTVMTKLDNCSGTVRLEDNWNGGSIIYSLKSNTITKFSSYSINSYHLKSIDTGLAQLEGDAIMNCNNLTDIKVAILNNDLSYQFATNCFNGLPTEGTITIDKNAGVTITDEEITSFFRTIVGEGWTITIE